MKAVRITTRAGAVRVMILPPSGTLQAWWFESKGLGEIVGEQWAMPFDMIALADLIEAPDRPQTMAQPPRAAAAEDVGAAIRAGSWKPEFQA